MNAERDTLRKRVRRFCYSPAYLAQFLPRQHTLAAVVHCKQKTILYANDAFARSVGFRPSQLVGIPIERVAPQNADNFFSGVDFAARNNEHFTRATSGGRTNVQRVIRSSRLPSDVAGDFAVLVVLVDWSRVHALNNQNIDSSYPKDAPSFENVAEALRRMQQVNQRITEAVAKLSGAEDGIR